MTTELDNNTKTKKDLQLPKKYKVTIFNDDYTPFDFVVEVLAKYFSKTYEESSSIAANVHTKGKDIVGFYAKNIAETKVAACMDLAKKNKYPLKLTVSKE